VVQPCLAAERLYDQQNLVGLNADGYQKILCAEKAGSFFACASFALYGPWLAMSAELYHCCPQAQEGLLDAAR